MRDPKHVIIGTSGSTDYLIDTTGNQRFWPVRSEPLPSDGEPSCDGLHDEGAPALYLCSRCFPDRLRGDLAEPDNDDYRHDEEEEIA